MTSETRLLLIGCGKMGGALLRRALSVQLATHVCVVEPSPPPSDLKIPASLAWVASADKINPTFAPDIVIFAIKPQSIAGAVPAYARFTKAVFLSIAAGIPLVRLEALLADTPAIIRAMPNLPASIGMGISVAVANKNVSAAERALGEQFLRVLGAVAWVEDEKLIDAVTALSGSGPAYVFALSEAMAKAGERLGLPPILAARLARATVSGSGALMAQSPESTEALRQAVTSPGGTTEAALNLLLADGGLFDLMQNAMSAAAERARELARVEKK